MGTRSGISTWKFASQQLEKRADDRLQSNAKRLFKIGDQVALQIPKGKVEERLARKGKGYWDGPFTVIRCVNESTYEVQGTELNRTHLSDIRLVWSGYMKPYTPTVPDPGQIAAQ